jgi:hypothetical protein
VTNQRDANQTQAAERTQRGGPIRARITHWPIKARDIKWANKLKSHEKYNISVDLSGHAKVIRKQWRKGVCQLISNSNLIFTRSTSHFSIPPWHTVFYNTWLASWMYPFYGQNQDNVSYWIIRQAFLLTYMVYFCKPCRIWNNTWIIKPYFQENLFW